MFLQRFHDRNGIKKGQSFVELALVLPVLLFLLVGFVEVGGIIYNYLSMLDVTREAARFASEHNPHVLAAPGGGLPLSACTDDQLHFYYDTACVIIGSGFNPDITLDPATDDVAISVFTIDDNSVTHRWPNDADGVWSLYSENWTKNCDGTVNSTTPFMTNAELIDTMLGPTATPGGSGTPAGRTDKGVALVELYYCHHQMLNLPIMSQLLPNPVRLHTFAVMPAPEAAPTPTPLP